MSALSAVVLAAGEGSRLRPLTRSRPKPMLPAATTPILARVLDELVDAGVTDITVVVGYRRERVQSYFGPTYRNVPLTYVGQRTQLGTGHALLAARADVDGSMLVINGDQIVDRRIISDVVSAHEGSDSVATLGLLRRPDVGEYGGVIVDDGGRTEDDPSVPIVDLVERPRDDRDYLLNAGVYALEPAIFEAIAETEPRTGEHSLIDAIAHLVSSCDDSSPPVRGVESDGLWVDATYPWDLLEVAAELFDRETGGSDTDGRGRQARPVSPSASVHDRAIVREPAVVADDCEIGPGAVVGPYACLGENVTVDAGAVVEHSVLDTDTRVGPNATVVECVTGQRVEIGADTTIPGGPGDVRVGDRVFEGENLGAVLADRVRDEGGVTYVPGAVVGPNATVRAGGTVRGTVVEGTEVRS
ncbi:sugar phosphate nucleotidyltransferase [Natrarchaeobius chitinivorans]|uniref:Bifunctional protein GlmU n=1 Tax=Natrarchaeobius chitinivorans TaxID=1679083 RepID=A0A3N6MBF7_NATCH|nr:sugar phosphate nucleotidyltransferase [Natrarchaeobius chitinivorans]RQG90986.1 nucleotidyl transferase [Natrarchaeobius chitinivorans]